MRHREIKGLKWARFIDRPKFIPPQKLKARWIAAGRRFESQVAKYLKARYGDKVLVGQWIEFEDENGSGLAQPDIIICGGTEVFCVECKLTYTPRKARSQTEKLYRPLLERIFSMERIVTLQVCRRMTKAAKGVNDILSSLDKALSGELRSGFYSVKFVPPIFSRST